MGISTLSVKQMEYKNAELVLIEFMSLQTSEKDSPKYSDYNLQEFHDFVADKIEALDPILWQKRWPYKKSWQ